MTSLLTPKEVANLLKVSPRTVYDRASDLGGFYPAGIRVLRFKQEVIRGCLEGQGKKGLEVQLPVPGAGVRRGRPSNKTGGNVSQRGQEKSTQANKDDDRHGLGCDHPSSF